MSKIEVVKNDIKEKAKAAWKFVKEHKTQFIMGGLGILTVGGAYCLGKSEGERKQHHIDEGMKILDAFDSIDLTRDLPDAIKQKHRLVDEEIFTDLAPEIENYVLDNGIEHAVSERSYDIGDNYHKLVKVDVTQVVGD